MKLSVGTKISDKIKEKIDEVVKDPKEKKFLNELLERVLTYGAKEESLKVKKEFKLILVQHFPYKESED